VLWEAGFPNLSQENFTPGIELIEVKPKPQEYFRSCQIIEELRNILADKHKSK
jgi:hypothetical protein